MRTTEAFQWQCGAQGDYFSSLAKLTWLPLALLLLCVWSNMSGQLYPFLRQNSALSKLPFLSAPSIHHTSVTLPTANPSPFEANRNANPNVLSCEEFGMQVFIFSISSSSWVFQMERWRYKAQHIFVFMNFCCYVSGWIFIMNWSAYFIGMSHTDCFWLLLPVNMLIHQLVGHLIYQLFSGLIFRGKRGQK